MKRYIEKEREKDTKEGKGRDIGRDEGLQKGYR